MIMIHRVFSHDTGCDSADHSHDRMLKQYMIGSGNYPNIGIRVKESHSGKFSDIASFFQCVVFAGSPGIIGRILGIGITTPGEQAYITVVFGEIREQIEHMFARSSGKIRIAEVSDNGYFFHLVKFDAILL